MGKRLLENIRGKIRNRTCPIFPSIRDIYFAIIITVATSIWVYLAFYQRHFINKRYLFFSFLIGLAIGIILVWIRNQLVIPVYRKLTQSLRIFSISASLFFTIVILLNIQIPPLYTLIPKTELNFTIPIADQLEDAQPLRLLWIKNGQGYVHFTSLDIDGSWEQEGKHIIFPHDQEAQVRWFGAVAPCTEVVFRLPEDTRKIQFLKVDNEIKEYLLAKENTELVHENQIDGSQNVIIPIISQIHFIYYLPFVLSFIGSISYVVFSLLIVLSNFSRKKQKNEKNSKKWIFYALPMLLLWTIVLLVFWPGILTNDGHDHWIQSETGNYNDWQSAIYSILIFLLTRIWYSPVIITIVQILTMAAVVVYGLTVLEKNNVHPLILWVIGFAFAISPINLIFVLTVWKDIPYAISFLWLTTILLDIFLSKGVWLKNKKNIAILGISAVCVAIFRKNGIAISVGTLLLLSLMYFQKWKYVRMSIGCFLFVFLLVKGPLYSSIGVSNESSGQSNLVFLHHIAAHVDGQTKLTEGEIEYLNSFMPLEEWEYWCYYVGPISIDKDFERNQFLSSSNKNVPLSLSLFLRNPSVDIKHTLCASELVWRVKNSHAYMKSTHGFNSWIPGNEGWIVPNQFNIREASFLPILVTPITSWLRSFGFADDFLAWYLRPALYLYLALFSLSVAFLRLKDWRIWLVGLPVFFQSAVLALISFAPAYRYQYGTYLAGLFMVGLLFLPKIDPHEVDS